VNNTVITEGGSVSVFFVFFLAGFLNLSLVEWWLYVVKWLVLERVKIFADLENNRSTGVPDFVCATSSISVEPDSCSKAIIIWRQCDQIKIVAVVGWVRKCVSA